MPGKHTRFPFTSPRAVSSFKEINVRFYFSTSTEKDIDRLVTGVETDFQTLQSMQPLIQSIADVTLYLLASAPLIVSLFLAKHYWWCHTCYIFVVRKVNFFILGKFLATDFPFGSTRSRTSTGLVMRHDGKLWWRCICSCCRSNRTGRQPRSTATVNGFPFCGKCSFWFGSGASSSPPALQFSLCSIPGSTCSI